MNIKDHSAVLRLALGRLPTEDAEVVAQQLVGGSREGVRTGIERNVASEADPATALSVLGTDTWAGLEKAAASESGPDTLDEALPAVARELDQVGREAEAERPVVMRDLDRSRHDLETLKDERYHFVSERGAEPRLRRELLVRRILRVGIIACEAVAAGAAVASADGVFTYGSLVDVPLTKGLRVFGEATAAVVVVVAGGEIGLPKVVAALPAGVMRLLTVVGGIAFVGGAVLALGELRTGHALAYGLSGAMLALTMGGLVALMAFASHNGGEIKRLERELREVETGVAHRDEKIALLEDRIAGRIVRVAALDDNRKRPSAARSAYEVLRAAAQQRRDVKRAICASRVAEALAVYDALQTMEEVDREIALTNRFSLTAARDAAESK